MAVKVPLCVALPREKTTAAQARRQVARALDDWGHLDQLDDALIVVSELVENVLLHTNQTGVLRVECDDDGVLIEVEDRSPQLPRVVSPDTRVHRGGLGMRMIHNTADRWGVRSTPDGGKVVWVRLTDRPRSALQAEIASDLAPGVGRT
jgi:anti-sigma regulatory factor (Ser/Thr protein kinase)